MTLRKKPVVKSGSTKKKKLTAHVDSRRSGYPIVASDASAGELEASRGSEERYHLFQGILQSSSDGILAVNRENEVLFANQRFVEMWMIPQETMAKKDDTLLLRFVLDQLSDPQGFLNKVRELYNSTEESFDTLNFKDGRVFDRLSRPLLQGTELRGRVWSFRDITERKRAAEALRESESFVKTVLDNLPIGIAVNSVVPTVTFDYMNDNFPKFYRTTREKLADPDAFWNAVYEEPAFREEMKKRVLDDLASGNPERMGWVDVPITRKGEETAFISARNIPIPNKPLMISTVWDVTDRKRIENALSASEAELRTLFASMHDVVLVIDREGVYRKIAPTNPRLLILPPEQLLGKNLNDVFPLKEAENFHGVVGQVLDTKQSTQIEYELVINGQTTWFQTTISPLDADSTLWVAHDITNRKQVEEALRIAEANYRSIFENATVGIYQSTPQGRFLSVNPVMAHIFGYDSPEEMINRITSIEDQFYVDPADRHEFQRLMMEQEQVKKFFNQFRHKDGSHIWVQENARAVKDANGSILHYEGFLTDITERKQAEEELRLVKDGLETANLELQHSLEREKLLASTDGLTGLCNRRHLFELAAREFQAAVRYRRPLTFLMFDVDDFKQVNDTLGHIAGDQLLVRVAQAAVAQVRVPDVVARYGGDEFIVLLPNASAQQALPVAERIRASVAYLRIGTDKKPFTITLSIGIAELRHEPLDENVDRIIQRADEALYKAKESGRNRTVIFGQDEARAN